jgi:tRNA threonylcarbamoyladenosine biosynthesis protein TsaB
MIDARRMEVFTAVYDKTQKLLFEPCALEIDPNSYKKLVGYGVSAFVGSGSLKVSNMFSENPQLFERQVDITPESLVRLTNQKYQLKQFEDVSGADALYLKAVHFPTKNS